LAEEPTAVATADAEAPAEPQPAPEPAAGQQPVVDWDTLQSQIDAAYDSDPKGTLDRLKKHRAIGGLAGSIAERQLERLRQQDQAQQEENARRRAIEELEREAEERPLEFAERFRLHRESEKTREQIANLERNTARKLVERIGEAYHGLPEWQDLSAEEKGKLSEAVKDATDDDFLGKFNRAALDIVADRRAEKRLADRLPKEKEAWQKEWEAERLAAEQGPDLRRPSSTTRRRVNWAAMSDEDFNKWWDSGRGRR
jgi:hypothetical protein